MKVELKDKRYQWQTPFEWLEWKVRYTNDIRLGRLQSDLLELAQRTDPDILQDMYQSDMDADGYFDEIETA